MAVRYRPIILLREAYNYVSLSQYNGIFVRMSALDIEDELPWTSFTQTQLMALDEEYFFNRSGEKKISPLLYHMLDRDRHIPFDAQSRIIYILRARFLPNWKALWETYYVPEHDFLSDVDITEEGTDSRTSSGTKSRTSSLSKTGTDNLSDVHGHQKNATDSLQHGEVVTNRNSGTQNNANGRYGFNSDEAVPTDESSTEISATETNEHNGTDARTMSETNSGTDQHNRTLNLSDSGTESGSESETGSGSYSKTRTGLSGSKSFQELIQQERNLWIEDYFERVFSDFDSVLTSPIYNRKHPVNPYSVYPFGYYNI